MKIEHGEDRFIDITVADKGTVGIPYECMLYVKAQNGSFSGSTSAWVEGIDMQAFIQELEKIDKTLEGKAILLSESPDELELEIKPVDTIGHFVLKVMVGKTTFIQSEVCEEKTMVVFPFESQSITQVCRKLAAYLEKELNA